VPTHNVTAMPEQVVAQHLIAIGSCLLSPGCGLVALRRPAVSIRERLIAICQRLIILARLRDRDDALGDCLVDLHAGYHLVNPSDTDRAVSKPDRQSVCQTVQRTR
jgi:hypothetical protein